MGYQRLANDVVEGAVRTLQHGPRRASAFRSWSTSKLKAEVAETRCAACRKERGRCKECGKRNRAMRDELEHRNNYQRDCDWLNTPALSARWIEWAGGDYDAVVSRLRKDGTLPPPPEVHKLRDWMARKTTAQPS